MNKARAVIIGSAAVLLIGVAVGEDIARRLVTKRYRQMVDARRQLELQVGEMVATHEQLKGELGDSQRRSQELTEALAQARGQLEEAVGRLAQESKSGRELNAHLSSVQRQMEQLQGELAVTLQNRHAAPKGAALPAVQLERVVVSDADAAALKGRIVSIHKDWNFVVIDLGWDVVRIGDTVTIVRNGEVLAKARVDRVQEDVCAATLLSESESGEVRINDLVRIL